MQEERQGRRSAATSVLIMAKAPRRGEVRRALEPEIGATACLALDVTLLLRTVRWGIELAPDSVYVACEPADGTSELRRLLGGSVQLFPQNGDGITGRVADAVARVYARRSGPVLIVWPDLPSLGERHARAALDDLRAGVDAIFGPAFDGGFYLIGVQRPIGALFTMPEATWRGPDSMVSVLRVAAQASLRVGLLRAERALHRPADVRAALADPMLPEDVSRALQRR